MKIYVNFNDFKCHTSKPDGVYLEVETDFFNNKCEAYIEGYRFVPFGESWTRDDGVTFIGEMIAPWRDYSELDAVQREYERKIMNEYKEALAELDAAMLDIQYQNLIGGL